MGVKRSGGGSLSMKVYTPKTLSLQVVYTIAYTGGGTP